MTTIEEVLAECKRVVDHPYEEIDKHIANGKKVIGVMPYYIPEELVYAAGYPVRRVGVPRHRERGAEVFPALLLLDLPDDARDGSDP